MSRARRPLHITAIMGAALLVASGCGGAEAEVPVDAGVTPAPGATDGLVTDPGTATDPNALAATDPATGLPIDPAAAGTGGGATATVPDLVGDDVVGGLSPVDNTPLFDAQAVPSDKLAPEKDETEKDDTASTTTSESVTFSGAKIYVDGITHTVTKNGTFPKGNPVFRLLSVSANDIEISLVAGEFTASGGDGTFLDKGDMVSLVNASEQVTYRVKYLRPVTDTSAVSF